MGGWWGALAVSQHIDTSKNIKVWTVSQRHNTLTQENTLMLGLCHNTFTPARTPRIYTWMLKLCYALHSYMINVHSSSSS